MADPNLVPPPSVLKDIIVPVCAVAALLISACTFILTLNDRRRAWRRQEDDDLRFVQWSHDESKVGTTISETIPAGSEKHLWAERMVERRKLIRTGHNSYQLHVAGPGSGHEDHHYG